MVSGPINCIKYLVFAFNLVFFLFGISLIGVGSYVQAQLSQYLDFFNTNVNGPAILLIVVGLVIFIISFFGCCGAIKENYCMILTFSVLMMIILICQIAGSIAGFVYYSQVRQLALRELKISMKNYENPDKAGVKSSWDYVQKNFECCGTNGPTDWIKIEGFENKPPASCCGEKPDCIYQDINSTTLGCLNRVEQKIRTNVYYVGSVGIALAIIQVTGIVLSCCLARAVRKEYDIA